MSLEKSNYPDECKHKTNTITKLQIALCSKSILDAVVS